MKGDVIIIEEHHKAAASAIVPGIVDAVKAKEGRYTITVAGESGSGKSETGRAIADEIIKPLVDYDQNSIEEETIDLSGVKVVIAEGTYTSLLKNVDTKVFIARNRIDTLEHRQKRNRGDEVGDPFIENVLKLEHKIIAGHKQLADFLITRDYEVLPV